MFKKNNFDDIRLFAAILVLCGHTYPLIGKPGPLILGYPLHHYGIAIFFSISGYLISHSWDRDRNVWRYFAKRCLRIFPALIVLVLLTAFFFGPLVSKLPFKEYFSNPLSLDYLNNIRLHIRYTLPGVFENNPYPNAVNGSLWSLPAEFFMYLLVPLLMLKVERLRIAFVALMAAAFIALDHWLTSRSATSGLAVFYATDIRAALEMGAFFLFGALIRLLRNEMPLKITYAIVALIGCYGIYRFGLGGPLQQIIFTGVLSYCVIAVGEASTRGLPNVARFGDFSYGVYLYAFPMQQLVIQKLGESLSPLILMVAAFIPTIVLAYLSWHCVEKYAISLKPGSTSKTGSSPNGGTSDGSHAISG
ncbi:acyltransferase family protein [Achromobacter denitrificans]|uniref:Acyltransferase n=1 Tax=Achromobacter denitrificans TaxID=32002 RepID=A0ABZ3FYG0_ACHDE|nr:acyltransferase [Achromobacter denitrificans]